MTEPRELTCHFSLTTKNLERSVKFYVEHLGFDAPKEYHHMNRPWFEEGVGKPGATSKIGFVRNGRILLELFEFPEPSGTADVPDSTYIGATHLGMQVRDLDEVYNRLTAAGVPSVSAPVTVDEGEFAGSRWCYVRDPDGFLIELYSQPDGMSMDDI